MLHPALAHMHRVNAQYPELWRQVDAARSAATWPKWCFIPMADLGQLVFRQPESIMQDPLAAISGVAAAAGIAAWRTTQTIYRFDETLLNLLSTADPDIRLPCEALLMLPEWCVYVETPGHSFRNQPLRGFFAHCEWDVRPDHGAELRLLLDYADDELTPIALPLHHETIRASIMSVVGILGQQVAEDIAPLISMLLYICSTAADLGAHRPLRPTPKNTKRGARLFPPNLPTEITAGAIIGASLRAAQAVDQPTEPSPGGQRTSPRPHWRRWHWHSFWVGTGENRRLDLRWIPPIPVNVKNAEPLPAVIRPV